MFNKKSKIFFMLLFSLILISIIITYNKYVIEKDFEVFTELE